MTTEKCESCFQLIATRITDYKMKNGFVSIDGSEKKKLEMSHSIDDMENINGKRMAVLHVNIKVLLSQGNKKLTIGATIEGCFSAPAELSDNDFESMLSINGTAALYSVARSFIMSTTAQALAEGKVTLPMMNIVEYNKYVQNEKSN